MSDISIYGKFDGGNSFVTFGQNECSDSRLYPNNAYYRYNKLRDQNDWPSNITGIYYGKGDCINCPKSYNKGFEDFSWKSNDLFASKISDINQFLMSSSKVGIADIHYKFLGPVFQRLIVGYQVFWPMQGYQNALQQFNTNLISGGGFGFKNSYECAENPGVGQWVKEYSNNKIGKWSQMKRKIMGDYQSPSLSQVRKLNMGAWYWPSKDEHYHWYINSNFNGPRKIGSIDKKFSELRIIFDSCSVSNIENRVRVTCPTPGSHVIGKSSISAFNNINYNFQDGDYHDEKTFGCFVEYFALIFTDKEKETLLLDQLGVVEATASNNFYDVSNSSTFNDLLQQYGLNIIGGHNISGFANIEITGFGLPRGVNINLCSSDYKSDRLRLFMRNNLISGGVNPTLREGVNTPLSIFSPDNTKFSGINMSKDIIHPWSEYPRFGLLTSGHYLDPPYYLGGFLNIGDGKNLGFQYYYLGHVKNKPSPQFTNMSIDENFYPGIVNGDGDSYWQTPRYIDWFCKSEPCQGCTWGYDITNRGFIPSVSLNIVNSEPSPNFRIYDSYRPLYFIHGFAGGLLIPTLGDDQLDPPGQGMHYCGNKSSPFLNRIENFNSPATEFFNNNWYRSMILNGANSQSFANIGQISLCNYLEDEGGNNP